MTAVVKLLPAIIWFGFTLFLLTLPGKDIPKIGWMEGLPIDKAVHIFMFFTLVILFFRGIVSSKSGISTKRVLLFIALAALAYGIAMEFVQKYWIPNRSFDEWDMVADGIGSFLPFLFINYLKKIFELPAQKSSIN